MAAKISELTLTLTLVVILMMWHGAWAQSGCSNALMSLSPCLQFVTGNSTKPSPSCCSSLMGLVQTQPQCLCAMINGGGPIAGIAVNQTMATDLPAACNMQTPPISQCSTANGPSSSAASPSSAPVGSPSSDSTPSNPSSDNNPDTTTPTTPSQSTNPSSTASGSKTVPSTTTGASSGAITITSPIPITMLFVLIFSVGVTRF